MELIVTEIARNDIDAIVEHTRKNWGDGQVAKVLTNIENTLRTVSSHPRLAKRTNRPDTFIVKVSRLPFVAIFEIKTDKIYVMQILYDRQNHSLL